MTSPPDWWIGTTPVKCIKCNGKINDVFGELKIGSIGALCRTCVLELPGGRDDCEIYIDTGIHFERAKPGIPVRRRRNAS